MLESPELESLIRQLGGSIVDTVDACTVLLTQSVKRSHKLLEAVGQSKPICSPKWLEACKKASQFLDPWEYVLVDKEAESKWEFSLKESLIRSQNRKLLAGYTFQIMVSKAAEVLKGAIEACGGKLVSKTLKGVPNFFVVAAPENKAKYARLLKQQPDLGILEPEAIFDGVLRQELRFNLHLLK